MLRLLNKTNNNNYLTGLSICLVEFRGETKL